MPEEIRDLLIQVGRDWWVVLAVAGTWITGIASALCWGFGFPRVFKLALWSFFVFAVGEEILTWLLLRNLL